MPTFAMSLKKPGTSMVTGDCACARMRTGRVAISRASQERFVSLLTTAPPSGTKSTMLLHGMTPNSSLQSDSAEHCISTQSTSPLPLSSTPF